MSRTGFELPAAQVSDNEIDALARELERRRAVKAAQDQEAAERAAERLEQEQQEQARRDAQEIERLRKLEIVDRARLVPKPSGLMLVENGLGGSRGDEIGTLDTQLRFGAVVLAEGPLALPVVAVSGLVSVLDAGFTLERHRIASQLMIGGTESLYLMAYRVAVRAAWEAAVDAEIGRAGEGPGVVLYTAGLPSVTVERDEVTPSLVRVVGTWGDCFAYELPCL